MVTVIGAPTKRSLGKITGSNQNAPLHVSDIHQYLGALPGLYIFIDSVFILGIVPDIAEMQKHSLLYGDFPDFGSKHFHHCHGIGVSFVGSPEPGHSNCDYIFSRFVQYFHRINRYQQSQGGIKASGNADDGFLRARMGYPPG